LAVSPLRALMAAQARSTWNRLQREGGEASVVAASLVALVAAAAVAPPVGACLVVGRSYGRGLAAGESLAASLTGFQALILGLAVLSGLLEHRLTFGVAGFRLYPIPRLSLLGAELAAGLLNLLTLLGSLCCLALALGLSIGAPGAAPVFLLIGLQAVLWIALVQHAVALAKRVLAGSRLVVAAAIVAVVALSLHLAPATGHGLPETVRGAARSLTAALQVLPFSQAYRGAEDLLQGRPAAGGLRQLALLAASALLFALVAATHFGSAGLSSGARRRKPERLWSCRSPVAALARVFQGQVLGSREGRIALFLPLVVSACLAVSIVAMSELQARVATGPLPWPLRLVALWASLPFTGIFLAFLPTMDELWLNQFGLDGAAIRSLLLLPVRPEQILLGRTLGMLRLQAFKTILGIGPLLYLCRPALAEVAWGLAASGTVFLVLAACGHLVSARLPRRVHEGAFLGSSATPLTAFLVPPAVQLPTFAVLVLTFKASAPLGPWGPALGMSCLLVAAVIGYARLLPFLAARVMALREHLVEELA
jgi:hypothetical protein